MCTTVANDGQTAQEVERCVISLHRQEGIDQGFCTFERALRTTSWETTFPGPSQYGAGPVLLESRTLRSQ